MSNAPCNNLNRAKNRSALGGLIGSKPADDTQIEVTQYDWHQPHYFSSSQLAKLNNFTKKVATVMAKKFAQLYHSDFNVTVTSTTQHFAGELFDQILSSGQNDYYLAFGPDQQHLCGFISIPTQTAVTWAKQLLGDAEPEKDASAEPPSKALSQLEESLLFDIACSIVESLSTCLCVPAKVEIQPAKTIVRGKVPIESQGIEEICKIVLGIKKAGTSKNSIPPGEPLPKAPSSEAPSSSCRKIGEGVGTQAYLIIPCSKLAAVVGKIVEADRLSCAGDISKAILNHLQQMPVSITAQLAVAVLTFEQLMSLRPADVLLLDKAIDEPVELIVEGRTLFRGQPAKSAGQYAVVVTSAAADGDIGSAAGG